MVFFSFTITGCSRERAVESTKKKTEISFTIWGGTPELKVWQAIVEYKEAHKRGLVKETPVKFLQ